MAEKMGSSSYGADDTGGSHGDYVHGCSMAMMKKKKPHGLFKKKVHAEPDADDKGGKPDGDEDDIKGVKHDMRGKKKKHGMDGTAGSDAEPETIHGMFQKLHGLKHKGKRAEVFAKIKEIHGKKK